ncbi:energy transducer TonB [uncultured Sphingomonas sp.]|uniref:energy transducer TonB n=1 Tax=uncultured Sphingomonas sp. TaxID=158754 RepID=UPI0035CAD2FE
MRLLLTLSAVLYALSGMVEADRLPETTVVRDGPVTPPLGEPGRVFGPDNYPPEARRAHEEGRVVTQLLVDRTGRVSDCVILGSSGSVILDTATCRLAKTIPYRPARDAKGRAVSAKLALAVRWEAPSMLESHSRVIETSYNDDGTLRSCQETLGQRMLANSAECSVLAGQPVQALPGAESLNAHTVRFETWFGYAGVPDAPHDPFQGFNVVHVSTIRSHVLANGVVSSCQEEHGGQAWVGAGPSCHLTDVATGKPYDETVVLTWGVKP